MTHTEIDALHNAPDADLLWVYRRDRQTYLREWRQGQRSTDFLYGLLALKERYHAGFIEDHGFNPIHLFWHPIERQLSRAMGAGFALHLALWHWRYLRRAKVIVSTGDVCGLPIAWLKSLGFVRARLIYITHGLSDHVTRFGQNRWLPRFYRRLLRDHVESLVTLSEGARIGLARWLGLPADRIHCLPYGTDTVFWHPDSSKPEAELVLSVGSDSGRDFDTLIKACRAWPLHLVTQQPVDLRQAPKARKTTQHAPVELRDLYRQARIVVVSLHDRDQPSGQSTGLQAMACGKALIVTKTRGWWGENFLQHEKNCLIVPPADATALEQAIARLWADADLRARLGKDARHAVETHFSESRMNAQIEAMILETPGVQPC